MSGDNEGSFEEIHQKTISKKWQNYLLEFLMIFLAITAGFFVDNYREQKIERSDEKDYIKSLKNDLEKDRVILEMNKDFGKLTTLGQYSLNKELAERPLQGHEKRLYHFLLLSFTTIDIPYHDRTISQLKFSGKFRIIQDDQVSEALVEYDKKVSDARSYENSWWHEHIETNTLNLISIVFDFSILPFSKSAIKYQNEIDKVHYPENLKLLNYDDRTIRELRNSMILSGNSDAHVLHMNNEILRANKKLDSLINRAYY